jgi:hypothetical protein
LRQIKGTGSLERSLQKDKSITPAEPIMFRRTLIATATLAALSFAASAADNATLVAAKAAKAPNPTVGAADPAWKKAKPLAVDLVGGANFKDGATKAVLKAVYTADSIYILLQYDDPNESVRRSPYQKQADGTWKKVKDPEDKGGDNNLYYEDKVGVIWNINDSIKGFNENGCAVACHTGEGKPYGNKYTESAGEIGDMWHLKSIRTGYIGQLDDGYVDNTRADKEKSPNAGRKTDPKTAGGYADVKLVDGKPEFMDKSGAPAREPAAVKVASAKKGAPAVFGTTYYLREENKVAFDDAKFKAGDEVASIAVAPFVGDRGDVSANIAWNKGKWTVVLTRKLTTGSKFDVQFADLKAAYPFGLAAFDNAQVRHAYNVGVLNLKFAQ